MAKGPLQDTNQRKKIAAFCFGACLLLLSAASCAPAAVETPAAPPYTTVRAATIGPGEPIPAPQGEIILTIRGAVGRTNAGDSLQFDIETLERLGVVEFQVDDKMAEGRVATFQGVLLSEVLAAAQPAEGATTLHTIALNDYAVDIPLTDAEDYPVLLATAVDGERMPVERYGPVRIIYPYHAFDLDPTLYDPRWIWQLATIEIRP